MKIYLNIFQIIILFGTINGFVWSILIFFNKKKKQANFYLSLLLFLVSLGSIKIILQEQIENFNYILPIPLLYQFALGPLLYLYLRLSLGRPYQRYAQILINFIPSLLFDVCATFMFFILRRHGYIEETEKLSFLLDILAFFSFSVYWLYSYRLVRLFQNNANGQHGRSTTTWAKNIIIASVTIIVTWLIYIVWVIGFHSVPLAGMQPYYPVYLIFCLCVYSIGIFGYYRTEFGMLSTLTYEKRLLFSHAELLERQKMVSERIKNDFLYRDDQLSLQKLSKVLGVSINELSYIINTGFKMNFNDLINEYRIIDFKEHLSDNQNQKYTLLAIAYKSGFNSKASFYRAFKKSTGKTPASFYKDLNTKK